MSDLATSHPKWIEDVRFEAVQRSLHAYRRAKRLRMLFLAVVAAASVARIAFPAATSGMFSVPVASGMLLLLAFFTFAAAWATRRQYADSLTQYESFGAQRN